MELHEVKNHVRIYLVVFAALAALTVITVGISTLDLSPPVAIVFALFVALVKGSLVASYFMHLISERGFIIWVLALCVLFFFGLLFGPTLTDIEIPR